VTYPFASKNDLVDLEQRIIRLEQAMITVMKELRLLQAKAP